MKKMLTIKKLGATVAFGLLAAPAFSQAPSTGLPFNESNKESWIKAHPEEYAKMNNQETNAKQVSQMTPAEKEAWIKNNPAEYAKMTNQVDPRLEAVRQAEAQLQAEKAALANQRIEVKTITLAEFHAFPAERQNFVRQNPHLFKVLGANGSVVSNF